MQNLIEKFTNSHYQIRVVYVDGVPYFPAVDVAKCLGYVDTSGAVRKHVDAEDKMFIDAETFKQMALQCNPDLLTGLESPNGLILINESGLYSLILRSHLPEAKKFKHWITSEVLPSIRQTGSYSLDDSPQIELSPRDKFNWLNENIKLCKDENLRDEFLKAAFRLIEPSR